MPYVRTRGNQIAIVHGARHPETRQVEQQVLFVLYSQDEAREAISDLGESGRQELRYRLQYTHPNLRFDWPHLRREIEARLDDLPATASSTQERAGTALQEDMLRFAKRLALTQPLESGAATQVLAERREALEVLNDWITLRLEALDDLAVDPEGPPRFRWETGLREGEVPLDLEELAQEAYNEGDDGQARSRFDFLVQVFPGYAEGWNYLGLIALRARRYGEAIAHFEKTVEVGRRALPKRVARRDWWSRHETRPYMRGLRNLAHALQLAGRYDEAIALATHLQTECDDDIEAAAYLACAYLCRGEWAAARKAALDIRLLFPLESVIAAFAALEQGLRQDAATDFMHAMINSPCGVAVLLGVKAMRPEGYLEIEAHNAGVTMLQTLRGYLAAWRPADRRFALRLWEATAEARAELAALAAAPRAEGEQERRAAYDREKALRSVGFARRLARQVLAAEGSGGGV